MDDISQKGNEVLGKQSKKAGKKAGKKAAKLLRKGIAKLLLWLWKFLVWFFMTVVVPFVLQFWLIIIVVLIVLIIFTIIFSFFGGGGGLLGDYEPTDKEIEMREYIEAQAESTIDQSKEEQHPYQLPSGILSASMQLEHFAEQEDNEEVDLEQQKETIKDIAERLSPEFTYKEFTPKVKEITVVCKGEEKEREGECEKTVNYSEADPISLITKVKAWDGNYDIEYEKEWGKRKLVNEETWEEESTYTDTETVEKEKEVEVTETKEEEVCTVLKNPITGLPRLNPITGEIMESCEIVQKEVTETETKTVEEEKEVEKTETVEHTEYEYESTQQFIPKSNKTEDYSLFEEALFSLGYTRNDIRLVETVYGEAGGEIHYTSWLEQEGLIGQPGGENKGYTSPGNSMAPLPPVDKGEFTAPTYGVITSPYGTRYHPIDNTTSFHRGLDIAPTNGGNPAVVSVADGIVTYSKVDVGGFGNYVVVSHQASNGKRYATVYGHLRERHVKVGDQVKKGGQLGVMGTTGHSTGVHLHFEIMVGTFIQRNVFNPVSNNQGIQITIPSQPGG